MEIIPPQLPPITLSVEVSGRDRKLRKQVRQLHQTVNSMLANQHLQLLQERQMSQVLDRLVREVEETRGAVDSAITLIQGLAQQIREGAADEEAMLALADDLDRQQGDLAAAVAAGSGSGEGSGGVGGTGETGGTGEPLEPAIEPLPEGGE